MAPFCVVIFIKILLILFFLNDEETVKMKDEIKKTTTDLRSILNYEIDFNLLVESIKIGFEEHFKIKFEYSLTQVKI